MDNNAKTQTTILLDCLTSMWVVLHRIEVLIVMMNVQQLPISRDCSMCMTLSSKYHKCHSHKYSFCRPTQRYVRTRVWQKLVFMGIDPTKTFFWHITEPKNWEHPQDDHFRNGRGSTIFPNWLESVINIIIILPAGSSCDFWVLDGRINTYTSNE